MNNVSTAFPYTFGALNVILTGLYGKENGVKGYYHVAGLKNDVPFLPEILKNNGYFEQYFLYTFYYLFSINYIIGLLHYISDCVTIQRLL